MMLQTWQIWALAIGAVISGSVLLTWLLTRGEPARAQLARYNAEGRLAAQARVAERDAAAKAVRAKWIEDAKNGLSGPWDKPSRPRRAGMSGYYNENIRNDRFEPDFRQDGPQYNPANGMPMVSGSMIDVGGHVYGSND